MATNRDGREASPAAPAADPAQTADDSSLNALGRVARFINSVLSTDDPLRQALAWLLAFLAVVLLFVGPTALFGTARAASAFVVVLVAVLVMVFLVNLLHGLSPVGAGTALRFFSLMRATLAAAVLVTVFLFADSAKWTVVRDMPLRALEWLHQLGWVTIADAVSALPPGFEPGDVRDGAGLIEGYRVSEATSPVSQAAGGVPRVDSKLLIEALSTRESIELSGAIVLADNSVEPGLILLAARNIRIANGTVLEIGRAKVVIVAEQLDIGTAAGDSAEIVGYRREGSDSAGRQDRRGRAAGSVTIVIAGQARNGRLRVDLRGEDGAVGVSGNEGPAAKAYTPDAAPRSGVGLLVHVNTDEGRQKARMEIEKFRRGTDGGRVCRPGEQCDAVLKEVEAWLDVCAGAEVRCPGRVLRFCIFEAEPGPNVPIDEVEYTGGPGGDGEDGGNGGPGGRLIVLSSSNSGYIEHISLEPGVSPTTSDRRVRAGASSGGIPGKGGPGGRAALPVPGGSADPDGACTSGRPGTTPPPNPKGRDGNPGFAGEPHAEVRMRISFDR